MKKFRFIHAADLHLGSPFRGFQSLPKSLYERLQQSGYRAFTKLIDMAIHEQADAVLLAGDIYAVDERNLKPQLFFQKEMRRLDESDIPVFVIHGNHDFLQGARFQLDLPENVFVFPEKVDHVLLETKQATKVNISGFSYAKRHQQESLIQHYQTDPQADFNVALLHGSLEGQTEHSYYAPFSLSELRSRGFDYWALGHIHRRAVLSEEPPVIYPGSLQGLNRKESGDKGFYLVELSETETKAEFVPATDVIWQDAEIKLKDCETISQVMTKIDEAISQFTTQDKTILLNLLLDFSTAKVDLRLSESTIWEMLQQDEVADVWVHRLQVKVPQQLKDSTESLPFFVEMRQLMTELSAEDYQQMLGSLTSKQTLKKFLPEMNEDTLRELTEAAYLELVNQWR